MYLKSISFNLERLKGQFLKSKSNLKTNKINKVATLIRKHFIHVLFSCAKFSKQSQHFNTSKDNTITLMEGCYIVSMSKLPDLKACFELPSEIENEEYNGHQSAKINALNKCRSFHYSNWFSRVAFTYKVVHKIVLKSESWNDNS